VKKRIKILLPVVLVGLMGLSLLFVNQIRPQLPSRYSYTLGESYSGEEVPLILNCSLPEFVSEVPSLRIIERSFTEKEILTIAKDLFNLTGNVSPLYSSLHCSGVNGSLDSDGPEELVGYRVRSGEYELIVYKSGAIRYSMMGAPKIPSKLPSFSQAKEISENFLQKVINYGLAPKTLLIEIRFSNVTIGAEAIISNGTVDEKYVTLLLVVFDVLFNGTPLCGEIGVEVSIGDCGEIYEFRAYWREVEIGEPVKITVSPEEAFERFREMHETMIATKKGAKKVVINDVRLSYFAYAPIVIQKYLFPVYLFNCTIYTDEGVFCRYLWISATNQSMEISLSLLKSWKKYGQILFAGELEDEISYMVVGIVSTLFDDRLLNSMNFIRLKEHNPRTIRCLM